MLRGAVDGVTVGPKVLPAHLARTIETHVRGVNRTPLSVPGMAATGTRNDVEHTLEELWVEIVPLIAILLVVLEPGIRLNVVNGGRLNGGRLILQSHCLRAISALGHVAT